MRWGNSGGLPVIVLAPVDVRDCFTLTVQAFNLAERFRCPVFIASNKEIAMTRETFDPGGVEKVAVIDRTRHTTGSFLPFGVKEGEEVQAFLPIGGPTLVRTTSSTHGPNGYITTDPAEIEKGVERLQRKIESHNRSFAFYDLERIASARTLIVTYGVTARAARAAVSALRHEDTAPAVSLLVIKTLWPAPEHVLKAAAEGMDRIIVLEMNLGQYVHEVRRILCGRRVEFYGKMSGRMITPGEIIGVLQKDPDRKTRTSE
jgi:2-oxoglutarate ferredoxin oxidoreductase subunit alpha